MENVSTTNGDLFNHLVELFYILPTSFAISWNLSGFFVCFSDCMSACLSLCLYAAYLKHLLNKVLIYNEKSIAFPWQILHFDKSQKFSITLKNFEFYTHNIFAFTPEKVCVQSQKNAHKELSFACWHNVSQGKVF